MPFRDHMPAQELSQNLLIPLPVEVVPGQNESLGPFRWPLQRRIGRGLGAQNIDGFDLPRHHPHIDAPRLVLAYFQELAHVLRRTVNAAAAASGTAGPIALALMRATASRSWVTRPS